MLYRVNITIMLEVDSEDIRRAQFIGQQLFEQLLPKTEAYKVSATDVSVHELGPSPVPAPVDEGKK